MKQILDKYINYEQHLDSGGDLYFKNATLKQPIFNHKAGEYFPHIYFYPETMGLVLWEDENQNKPALTYTVLFENITFVPAISINLTQKQAVALRNFLSEHAYPTMHEQPEIAAIFDELQSKVGM